MKYLIIVLLTLFILVGCEPDAYKIAKTLNVGDRFTLQHAEYVDKIREDKDVIVYFISEDMGIIKYGTFISITRKDSLIYSIREGNK